MRAISYEWGSPNAKKNYSPDDGVLLPLGQNMRKYSSGDFYPKADAMNPLVYPVKGGMEDWAYASSWDKTPGWVNPCTPKTYTEMGVYPKSKTTYTTDMLRTLNLLIETNSAKTPNQNILGAVHQILRPKNAGGNSDGDISRNVRLMLMTTDLVRPYVRWSDDFTNDDTILQKFWNRAIAGANQRKETFRPGDSITLKWEVGGALQVDDTKLNWFTMPAPQNHPNLDDLDCSAGGQMDQLIHSMYGTRLKPQTVNADQLHGHKGSVWYTDPATDEYKTPGMQNDNRGWSSSPLYPDVDEGVDGFGFGSGFVVDFNPSVLKIPPNTDKKKHVLVVFVSAEVDKGWSTPTRAIWPVGDKPYSHLVRARNDDKYSASNGEHTIQGGKIYLSKPLCIIQQANEGTVSQTTTLPPDPNQGSAHPTTTETPTGFTTTTTTTTNGPSPFTKKPTTTKKPTAKTKSTTSTTPKPTSTSTPKSAATPGSSTKTDTSNTKTPTKKNPTKTTTAQPTDSSSPVKEGETLDVNNVGTLGTQTNAPRSVGTVFMLLLLVMIGTCCCLLLLKCAGFGFDDDSGGGGMNGASRRSSPEKLKKKYQSVKKKVKSKINSVSEKRRRRQDMRESAKKSRRDSGMMSEIVPLTPYVDEEDEGEELV